MLNPLISIGFFLSKQIDSALISNKIALGRLVQTNGMNLFIANALPNILIYEKAIIAVYPQSPLGNKLMGNTVGFEFETSGTKYILENIN